MMPTNPKRYWFSFWDNPTFANGWVFGDTVNQAIEAAKADILRWHPEAVGEGTITLQRDTSPAAYFDRRVKLVAPTVTRTSRAQEFNEEVDAEINRKLQPKLVEE